ncbi:MAG TPA: Holliday junction resolvase RuvX [Nakamurella sp.]
MIERTVHNPSGDAPAKGVRLGVDVGTVRVGVARSDPAGILATPVTTLMRTAQQKSSRTSGDKADLTPDLAALRDLVAEHDVVEVVVGLPTTLRGMEGSAVTAARAYGQALAVVIAPVPVVYVDERLTTVTADRLLTQAGVKGKAKRAVVDQVAATRILQNRLDQLAGGGHPS